jgi:hypothetical protein
MPKSVIINLDRERLLEQTNFKQLALFFDSVYVDDQSFRLSKREIEMSENIGVLEKDGMLSEINWLAENGLLKTYNSAEIDRTKTLFDPILIEDVSQVGGEIIANYIPVQCNIEENQGVPLGDLQLAGVIAANNQLIFKLEDIRLRMAADYLSRNDNATHFVPLVNSFDTYQKRTSVDSAIHFVLNKIPVPQQGIPWKQIVDFRNDDVVKRKYFALLNWVNEVANKNIPVPQLIDEYNYLYSEYMNQYKLHQLSIKLTTIELLIVGSMEFFSSLVHRDLLTAFKGLIHFRKEMVSLSKSEKEIQGRELAYIFEANKRFS